MGITNFSSSEAENLAGVEGGGVGVVGVAGVAAEAELALLGAGA
jgi:hypothetical protein